MIGLDQCDGFEWDPGNSEKNWINHRVTRSECEQVFLNVPLLVADDPSHAQTEPRAYVLGRTDLGRELFVVFTVRGTLVRVISARDLSQRERRIYRHALEESDSEI